MHAMDLLFADTETTGFGDCRMIEIAHKTPGGKLFTCRVKPPIPIEAGATAVHGITDEMLTLLPAFIEHPEYGTIKRIIETSLVVFHNAPFDIAVLAREGIAVPTYLDTQKIAKHLYPHAPNHKLQGLRDYLRLEGGDAHSAGGDVLTLESLFVQMHADMELKGTAPDDVIRQMMIATLH